MDTTGTTRDAPIADPAPDPVPDPVPDPAPDMAEVVAFPTATPATASQPGGPERLRHVIGDVLRDERNDQRRTLADVARTAHVSLAYLSEVERGRKEASSDVLAAICDALALPLPDLLDRSARRLRVGMQRGTGIQLLAA